VDLELETWLDDEIRNWLAFSVQKLNEVALLGRGLNQGEASIQAALEEAAHARQSRQQSSRIHNPVVQERLRRLTQRDCQRNHPFAQRQSLQRQHFQLPLLPTTTIGSF